MSFLLNVITGYLNEDAEIKQSQAEYDRKVQEARRKALEEEKKDARKFKQELYKSNYNFYGEVNKKFMESKGISFNTNQGDKSFTFDSSFFGPDAQYTNKFYPNSANVGLLPS